MRLKPGSCRSTVAKEERTQGNDHKDEEAIAEQSSGTWHCGDATHAKGEGTFRPSRIRFPNTQQGLFGGDLSKCQTNNNNERVDSSSSSASEKVKLLITTRRTGQDNEHSNHVKVKRVWRTCIGIFLFHFA